MGVESMFPRMESVKEVTYDWGGEDEKHPSMALLA
jgi:hypothetical protein